MRFALHKIMALVLAGLAAGALSAQAAEPRPAAAQAASDAPRFESFAILLKNNIFDPQRQPVSRPVEAPPAPLAEEKIALQGVFIDDTQAVAFFEGTSSQYNAAVHLGGTIGGCQVASIRTDRVLLAASEHRLELPVARQLVRRGSEPWRVTSDTTPLFASASPTPAPPISAPSATSGNSSGYGGSSERRDYGDRGGRDYRSYGDRSSRSYGDRGGRDYQSGSSGDRGSASGSPPPAASPTPAPPGPAPAGASQDEILRMMMERRRKEMGQ